MIIGYDDCDENDDDSGLSDDASCDEDDGADGDMMIWW